MYADFYNPVEDSEKQEMCLVILNGGVLLLEVNKPCAIFEKYVASMNLRTWYVITYLFSSAGNILIAFGGYNL